MKPIIRIQQPAITLAVRQVLQVLIITTTMTSFAIAAETSESNSVLGESGRYDKLIPSDLLDANNSNLPYVKSYGKKIENLDYVDVATDRDGVSADGCSEINFTVTLKDVNGQPLIKPVMLTLEQDGQAKIRLEGQSLGCHDGKSAFNIKDADPNRPGIQVLVEKGIAKFSLIAPSNPEDTKVRVTAGDQVAEGTVTFLPQKRDLIATGLIEGAIHLNRLTGKGSDARRNENDLFETEIRNFSQSPNDGKTAYGARAELFLKGTIKGEYLLTTAYDSDKTVRSRLFRDIRPEEFYPIYGDASIKNFEAQSSKRFYVRVDKNKSYLLYGDFNTSSAFEAQSLGQFSRSMTGLNHHLETERVKINSFITRDALTQVVDEMPARGVSGPYIVSNLNGVRQTEKVEIITRDRNQPSVILNEQQMIRFDDYVFEPFSGQILFKAPVSTLDERFNPRTIRVTYEVEQGGAEFNIYGVDGRIKLGDRVEVGGSFAKDENPGLPYELKSANVEVKITENTKAFAEIAQSETNNFGKGNAWRAEIRHQGTDAQFRASAANTDIEFNNPSATIQGGREEYTLKGRLKLTSNLSLYAEGLETKDKVTDAKRQGIEAGLSAQVTERLGVDVGVRHSKDEGGAANANIAGISNIVQGQGFTPYLYNSAAFVAAPQLTSATSIPIRARYKATDKLNLTGEAEFTINSQSGNQERYSVGADYAITEHSRVYSRYEWINSSSGEYGLNDDTSRSTFAAGVTSQYMEGGELYSEYRMADAQSGREADAAMGLRNTWKYAKGIDFLTNVEHVRQLGGDGREAYALGGGVELTYDPNWKGSGRVEFRQDDSTNAYLSTAAYSAHINKKWSFIARNYLNAATARLDTGTDNLQDRLQVGMAFRPTNSNVWNALARYELKYENQGVLGEADDHRVAHIISTNVAYHPNRQWWADGRFAMKYVTEKTATFDDHFSGYLAGGRAVYDITERFDLGLLGSVLYSPDGNAIKYAIGVEGGALLFENMWASIGYNFAGFKEDDLNEDVTQKGLFFRLRYKFDEEGIKRIPLVASLFDK